MPVIGCLLLFVLPLLGIVAGGLIGGTEGAKWGAGIGLAIALVVFGGSSYALYKATRQR